MRRLESIDILKTDAAEAEILTGLTDRQAAARQLIDWGVPEVLISYNTEMLSYDGRRFCVFPVKSRQLSGRTLRSHRPGQISSSSPPAVSRIFHPGRPRYRSPSEGKSSMPVSSPAMDAQQARSQIRPQSDFRGVTSDKIANASSNALFIFITGVILSQGPSFRKPGESKNIARRSPASVEKNTQKTGMPLIFRASVFIIDW